MAIYRQIHTHIWDDPKFEEYSPMAKLVFIHGFSNKHRNEAGLYTITVKKIAFETGLTIEQTQEAIKEIVAGGSWAYDWDNHVLWIKNALKYQSVGSKTIIAILKDVEIINSPLVEDFKTYYNTLLYPIDTLSIPFKELIETPSDKDKGNSKDNGNGKGKDLSTGADPPQKRFTPPTFEQVQAYCLERKNNISPERFIDHYTANGWVQKGGQKIKDWKAAVRTWETNNKASPDKVVQLSKDQGREVDEGEQYRRDAYTG